MEGNDMVVQFAIRYYPILINLNLKGLTKIEKLKDLSGDQMNLASEGLRRLQRFYEIPTIDMAAGKYKDRIIGSQLDGKNFS